MDNVVDPEEAKGTRYGEGDANDYAKNPGSHPIADSRAHALNFYLTMQEKLGRNGSQQMLTGENTMPSRKVHQIIDISPEKIM